jgi:hypothetical protein
MIFRRLKLVHKITATRRLLDRVVLGHEMLFWIKQRREREKVELAVWTDDDLLYPIWKTLLDW